MEPTGLRGQPTLQVGGEQDAVIAPAPVCVAAMVQGEPAVQPAVPPVVSAAGEDETQVSGAFGTMQP